MGLDPSLRATGSLGVDPHETSDPVVGEYK